MTARDYTAKAIAIVNAGSAIKSKIKEALEDMNRAFEREVGNQIQELCLTRFSANREAGVETPADMNDIYYGVTYLHTFNAKKIAIVNKYFAVEAAELLAKAEMLINLRNEVKAVEVVKFERKESTEEKIKAAVIKSYEEVSAERKATFDWAKEIIREYNNFVHERHPELDTTKLFAPVSCQSVYCRNYFGTSWVRVDWYIDGVRKPFNLIAASVEAIIEEQKGK